MFELASVRSPIAIVLVSALLGCSGDPEGTGGGGGAVGAGGAGGGGGEGGAFQLPPLPLAAVPTKSSPKAPMNVARAGHTATLLADGSVVVIGGERLAANRDMLASVERYDPASDTWTELAPLPEPRDNHTATLLPDGTILIVGGGKSNAIGIPSGEQVRAEVLLYDPATGTFESLGPNLVPRHGHFAALLPSGRVLLVGGAGDISTVKPAQGAGNPQPFGNELSSAEIYDPKTRSFSQTGDLLQARFAFGAASLADGRVLVAGGASYPDVAVSHKSAEIYDEVAGGFVPAGSFAGVDRLFLGISPLADGRVLVAGGKKANVVVVDDIEVFDPSTNDWQKSADAPPVRTLPIVVPTQSGGALVMGGLSCAGGSCSSRKNLDVWSPDGAVEPGPSLLHGRTRATATVLPTGSVLVAGGYTFDSLAVVELLEP
ncbi:MAG: hypothetical protein JNL21_35685 [Myxococcales bacterium]|nr:hypothetical protein [Myxococcales bacterium]